MSLVYVQVGSVQNLYVRQRRIVSVTAAITSNDSEGRWVGFAAYAAGSRDKSEAKIMRLPRVCTTPERRGSRMSSEVKSAI